MPDTPILALTATATAEARYDIQSMLGLRNPLKVLTTFDRPNLEFIVHQKTTLWNDLNQWVITPFQFQNFHFIVIFIITTILFSLVNFSAGN